MFAPTNAAFEKLPKDTVPTLLKPENKAQLTGVLTYHVVAGTYSAAKIEKDAAANGGKLMLKTVEGRANHARRSPVAAGRSLIKRAIKR